MDSVTGRSAGWPVAKLDVWQSPLSPRGAHGMVMAGGWSFMSTYGPMVFEGLREKSARLHTMLGCIFLSPLRSFGIRRSLRQTFMFWDLGETCDHMIYFFPFLVGQNHSPGDRARLCGSIVSGWRCTRLQLNH